MDLKITKVEMEQGHLKLTINHGEAVQRLYDHGDPPDRMFLQAIADDLTRMITARAEDDVQREVLEDLRRLRGRLT